MNTLGEMALSFAVLASAVAILASLLFCKGNVEVFLFTIFDVRI